MATVNDEDRACVNATYREGVTLGQEYSMTAAYRERVEARVREEVTNNLADQLNARDKRIADLEAQLYAKHAKLVDVADKLAAAKPVLTAEERAMLDGCRHQYASEALRCLVAIIDRLCPPPKAQPTDAELADKLDNALTRQCNRRASMREVVEALRARGVK